MNDILKYWWLLFAFVFVGGLLFWAFSLKKESPSSQLIPGPVEREKIQFADGFWNGRVFLFPLPLGAQDLDSFNNENQEIIAFSLRGKNIAIYGTRNDASLGLKRLVGKSGERRVIANQSGYLEKGKRGLTFFFIKKGVFYKIEYARGSLSELSRIVALVSEGKALEAKKQK